jgi:hypothetical protein
MKKLARLRHPVDWVVAQRRGGARAGPSASVWIIQRREQGWVSDVVTPRGAAGEGTSDSAWAAQVVMPGPNPRPRLGWARLDVRQRSLSNVHVLHRNGRSIATLRCQELSRSWKIVGGPHGIGVDRENVWSSIRRRNPHTRQQEVA